MKTYVCDMCGNFINNPIKRVRIREVFFKKKPYKKEKIHLCESCWVQIAEISRKKRTVKIPDNYTEFSGSDTE